MSIRKLSARTTAAFNGFIDDLRITAGFARYTANFSVPTGSLPQR